MKCEIRTPETFVPFTLNVTCETLEDLKLLWARMNVNLHAVKTDSEGVLSPTFIENSTYSIFEVLDKEIRKYVDY